MGSTYNSISLLGIACILTFEYRGRDVCPNADSGDITQWTGRRNTMGRWTEGTLPTHPTCRTRQTPAQVLAKLSCTRFLRQCYFSMWLVSPCPSVAAWRGPEVGDFRLRLWTQPLEAWGLGLPLQRTNCVIWTSHLILRSRSPSVKPRGWTESKVSKGLVHVTLFEGNPFFKRNFIQKSTLQSRSR